MNETLDSPQTSQPTVETAPVPTAEELQKMFDAPAAEKPAGATPEALEEWVETAEDVGETALEATTEAVASPEAKVVPIPVTESEAEDLPPPVESVTTAETPTDGMLEDIVTKLDNLARRMDEFTRRHDGEDAPADGGGGEEPPELPPTGEDDPGDSEEPEVDPDELQERRAMSGKARTFFERMMNRVYESPAKEIVGKIGIGWNEIWLKKRQAKAVALKGELDRVNAQIDAFDRTTARLETTIKKLQDKGRTGTEGLQLQIQENQRDKNRLLEQRDKIQTAFEAQDNRVKDFTNRRDRIANRLIESYDKELGPLEAELDALQDCRLSLELETAAAEAHHKEQQAELEEIKEERRQVEQDLRDAGMSEQDIMESPAITALQQLIEEGEQKIDAEKAELQSRAYELSELIGWLEEDANPIRDRRDYFERRKNPRPIEMDVPARERENVPGGPEWTTVRPRPEAEASEEEEDSDSEPETERGTGAPERSERENNNPTLNQHVEQLNRLLSAKFGAEAVSVNADDLVARIRTMTKGTKLEMSDFKKIVTAHLKIEQRRNKDQPIMEQFNKVKGDLR